MSKLARSTIAAGLAAIGLAAAAAAPARAAIVYMNLSDIHPTISGVAAFDGAKVVALGGTDDFVFNYGGFSPLIAADASFNITSGFLVTNTLIADSNLSGGINTGDSITASIGPGTFEIKNSDGVLVTGLFTGATLNTSVGSSTVNINSSNAKGLDLTPGPVLSGLGYSGFDPNESFALSIVGINPGVQVVPTLQVTPRLWLGNMMPFGISQDTSTSGSVDLVANLVPEPTSLGLLGAGALALVARRRRPSLKKVAPWALAVAGGLTVLGGGTKAQAAVLYMNLSDIHSPIGGVAGYDASSTNVVSLGGIDTFTLSGAVSHAFADAHFQILSGFQVTDTVVSDDNLNNAIDLGDTVTSVIGPGTFRMVNPSDGNLVFGSFTSATLSTTIGSTAVTINSANSNGLDLSPEAGLTALGVLDLNPVESFALNIVGINPGISVSNPVQIVTGLPFYSATLDSFALGQSPSTSGSVDLVANAVVPEPASLGLLSAGALGLLARRSRRA